METYINLLERIRLQLEPSNWMELARRLNVAPSKITDWRQRGFIPERHALDIEALGLRDQWGDITATAVLTYARAVKAGYLITDPSEIVQEKV